jgi:SpoVK/Ycf46/Vps4 family AAA+-type ATPase
MNRMNLEDFLYALHGNVDKLVFLDKKQEVHHDDEDRKNNKISNLVIVSKAEHSAIHMQRRGNPDKFRWMGRTKKVLSITSAGKESTFDISMKPPYHSFLANDLIVHNSGKSLCAKATAAFLKLPCLRLDMGRVARSLYGESEAALRLALQVAEAVAPVVMWIDEIDKGFAGISGSGNLDSGVTSRTIQTFLTWRQETRAAIFIAATANTVENLPSMVYRKGRFDEVWATDLPSKEERSEIFSIHLKKRGRDPKKFNLQSLAKETPDFVGAEIESCIEDAMFSAFDKGKEVDTDFVLGAIEDTVPQAKRDKVEIQKIQAWVQANARLVSGRDAEERQGIGFKSDEKRTVKVKKRGE